MTFNFFLEDAHYSNNCYHSYQSNYTELSFSLVFFGLPFGFLIATGSFHDRFESVVLRS